MREHSRTELSRKLARHTDDPAEIAALLDDFEQRGWLSESRFVEQTVHSLATRYGMRRIVHKLREKGVSDASIASVQPYLKQQAQAAAQAVLKRKFDGPPDGPEARARQARFLLARGFDYDVIRKVLNWHED